MVTLSTFIIYLLITLAIVLVLFLLLRELNCWYWKINERINLQKEILSYLKKIANPEVSGENISKNESEELTNKGMLNSLSEEEKQIIDDFRMKGLGFGEKIIIHKTLRNILKVSAKDWKSYGNYQNDWIIIIE